MKKSAQQELIARSVCGSASEAIEPQEETVVDMEVIVPLPRNYACLIA